MGISRSKVSDFVLWTHWESKLAWCDSSTIFFIRWWQFVRSGEPFWCGDSTSQYTLSSKVWTRAI